MKTRIAIGAGISLLILPLFLARTGAQSAPEVLMTWRAESYVPVSFSGKALPAPGSTITASFELIENGGAVDVSDETVYWYINRKPIREGLGLKTISFAAPETPGSSFELRARINGFRGEDTTVLGNVQIPVATPEAVIEAPYPEGRVRTATIRLLGYPYYFNVADPNELTYSWRVNGQTPAGSANPNQLDLTVVNSGEATLSIDLSITGGQTLFDSAAQTIRLLFAP